MTLTLTLLLVKLLPNFNIGIGLLGSGNLNKSKTHLERFENETYMNALRWPLLCKKTYLTITFELRHYFGI